MLIRSLATLATLAGVAVTVTVTAVAPAAAQSAAQAEIMFRNGKRLLAQGKVAEACAAFDASQKLEPTVSTLLNQANCREKNGQLATAWGLFLDAERDTRASGDEDGKQLHQVALDHASKLEARLSTLTIVVPADRRPSGLEIRRGNDPVDPVMWNQALPIDGGTYKIVARAPGAPEWSTSITIASENDAKSVEIPRIGAEAAPARSPAASPTAAKPAATKAPATKASAAKPPATRAPAEPTRPAGHGAIRPPAPAPAAESAELRLPGDGKTPWYCTDSHRVFVGTCRPEKERCEEFRDTMIAQVRDLTPCRPAYSVVCFGLAGAPHCAPSEPICETLRAGVLDRATACQTRRVAPEPPPPPRLPQWWCTESRVAGTGICKLQRTDCETFRTSLAARQPDTAACHEAETATCFEIAGDSQPHCAPGADICDALREQATARPGTKATACHARRVQPDPATAPAPTRPAAPAWWCTDSRSSDVGICKPARGDCEAFRSSLLERRHDLSECHEVATAMCFEAGGSPHCGPSREVCEALREASHQTAPCRPKTLPAPRK